MEWESVERKNTWESVTGLVMYNRYEQYIPFQNVFLFYNFFKTGKKVIVKGIHQIFENKIH